ncbi:MAG: efflux RND transporter periplasmic adaptor subunit [Planctomycetota bacterium]
MKRLNPKWKRGLTSGGVVAGVAVAVVVFGWASRSEEVIRTAGPGVEPLVVPWAEVAWDEGYEVQRRYVGRVEAKREADLGFEIGGLIVEIGVDEGQAVTAGQVLASLDTRRLEARRAELEAQAEQAEASAELAAIRLERITRMHAREATTADELDEARSTARAADADVARARAAVRSVEVDIEKAELVAPFDAVVAVRSVDEGRVVDAGTAVVRLLERSRPEVRVGIGGDAIESLAVGEAVSVEVRGERYAGRVRAILPTRDQVGRGVDALIELEAELGAVRSGDLGRVSLPRRVAAAGFWVPMQALTEGSRGLWSLYVLDGSTDDSGRATLRRADVEVLHEATDRAYVRGPFEAGVRVVVGGLHRVGPGMAVRLGDRATEMGEPG